MSNDRLLPPARTLPALLQARAEVLPDQAAYIAITASNPGDLEGETLTYAELQAAVSAVASRLQERFASGERALLFFPSGLGYMCAFLGCLQAGIIAVPAYPPSPRRADERIQAIFSDASPVVVLTTTATLANRERVAGFTPGLAHIPWMAVDPEVREASSKTYFPSDPADVAFLQYTSGSTRTPRGVMVSHANLMHNLGAFQEKHGLGDKARTVCWLPLHHDAGLIGNALQSLYIGGTCILMPPLAFIQNPLTWLAAITHYQAQAAGGPNFTYEACLAHTTPDQRHNLDLKSWEVALNGAEPVHPDTLLRFSEAFAPYGFKPRAFLPAYGLAEATLIVAAAPGFNSQHLRQYDRKALAAGTARPPATGEEVARLVSCGRPARDTEVRIIDPETLLACAPGIIGEIWVRGPGVATGYWDRPSESAETFQAQFAGSGPGFLRTGDLGFLDNGELIITGRLKDVIIFNGRNYYPQDILYSLARLPMFADSLVQGGGAVFSLEEVTNSPAIGNSLVLVLEIRKSRFDRLDAAALAGLLAEIHRLIAEEHQLTMRMICLTTPGSVPQTTSGKIRHQECRARLLAGDLPLLHLHLNEPSRVGMPAKGSQSSIKEEELRKLLAEILGCQTSQVGDKSRLSDLGFNLAHAVQLRQRLRNQMGFDMPITLPFDYPTFGEFARQLAAGAQNSQVETDGSAADKTDLNSLSIDEIAGRLAEKLRRYR